MANVRGKLPVNTGIDALLGMLEELGVAKGAIPMPKNLGVGRKGNWQKGVEQQLEAYKDAIANARANVEIPRGVQTSMNMPPVASRTGLPATIPSAKSMPKVAPKLADVVADFDVIPPVIKGKFSPEMMAKLFPSESALAGQLANTSFDAVGAGSLGTLAGKVAPKMKAALPSLDDLMGVMKNGLDMSKLGSLAKGGAKSVAGAVDDAAVKIPDIIKASTTKGAGIVDDIAAKGAVISDDIAKALGAGEVAAAEEAAKAATKKAGLFSKLPKKGKLGLAAGGLGLTALIASAMMGEDAPEEVAAVNTAAAPQQDNSNALLMQALLGGGARSSELDKVLGAMASQIRVQAANAERQNLIGDAIARASANVSDRM